MGRKLLIALMLSVLALAAMPAGAWALKAEGPLGDPLPAPVQDPSLPAHHFPPTAVTAGAADAGGDMSGPKSNCSAVNSCALPTPARDRVAAVRPSPDR